MCVCVCVCVCGCVCVCVLWNEKRGHQLVFHVSTLQLVTAISSVQLKFDIYIYIFVPFCMHAPFCWHSINDECVGDYYSRIRACGADVSTHRNIRLYLLLRQ